MKKTIQKYKYTKELSPVEIEFPEQPFYYKNDNYRTVVGVFPEHVPDHTHLPDNVYDYIIIYSTRNKEIRTFLRISMADEILSTSESGDIPQLRRDVLNYIINYFGTDSISKDSFLKYLNAHRGEYENYTK